MKVHSSTVVPLKICRIKVSSTTAFSISLLHYYREGKTREIQIKEITQSIHIWEVKETVKKNENENQQTGLRKIKVQLLKLKIITIKNIQRVKHWNRHIYRENKKLKCQYDLKCTSRIERLKQKREHKMESQHNIFYLRRY